MKTINVLLFLFATISVFCQSRPEDAYFNEEKGYFINVRPALNGYVFTDNYCNSLYYLENGELQALVSAPGCGRYFTVSPDGKFVGYKHISNAGQIPAVINLENGKTEFLDSPVNLCGQPVFFNGGVAFTSGKTLIILSHGTRKEFDLDYYSNIVAISPDGCKAAYSFNDRIKLIDLNSGQTLQISEETKMSSYPRFSPDGEKILFQSDKIYVYEILTDKIFDLGYGLAPEWSFDSENIVFHNTTVEEYTLTNAEIYTCNYKNPVHINLTNTDDVIEMQPVFVSDSQIIYNTYSERQIYKLNINTSESELIYKHNGELNIAFFNVKSTKSEVLIPGEVPYTHQVYDTPDSHYGYGSCAPTCAIMAISYYNKLPKWPTPVTKLYPHTSYYGSYVSTRYRLNEHYFTESEYTDGGDLAYGGYGYMWGLGSPNSQMRNYMELHYFESSQLWNNSVTFESVLAEIDNQYPLPMCVMLSSAGHLILAKGYIEDQHTLIFSEPYGDKNTPSWPSYDGQKAYYDWPGYNNGYENLDYNGTYGVIAWTVTAHNQEVAYNDTIIDDVYYQHGFEMNNSENTSTMRYFRDQNAGYNGHAWWTLTEATENDICWVRWIPTLTQEGHYRVSAYIPSACANAQNAPYKVKHGDETTTVLVNQNEYNDEWADLGVYNFIPGQDFRVYLGDSTGISSDSIAYDAVKFEYLPDPVAAFETAEHVVCVNTPVSFTNLSTNALSYYWTFSGDSDFSSTDENPVVNFPTGGYYTVKMIAYGLFENDSIEYQDFIEAKFLPDADFEVNSHELYLPDAIAYFTNTSEYAESFQWDFDNYVYSWDINPYVIYTDEGSYTVTLTAYTEGCPASVKTDSQSITVHGSTIIENTDMTGTELFPNPAKDILKINSGTEILSAKIIDYSGKTLIMLNEGNLNSVDISGLATGIYLLELQSANGRVLKKVVVER